MDINSSVSHNKQFILCTGRRLKNLHELANALSSISTEEYAHHVTPTRNDFSSWVHHVFRQEVLGRDMFEAKSKHEMTTILHKALFKPKPKSKFVIGDAVHQTAKAVKHAAQSVRKPRATHQTAQAAPVELPPAVNQDLKEILKREREIDFKEKKILEVERHIEKRLARQDSTFFSREFVQGMVTGFLLTLIVLLIYIKYLAY